MPSIMELNLNTRSADYEKCSHNEKQCTNYMDSYHTYLHVDYNIFWKSSEW